MKTALVTGANRGLGRGFVDYLTQQGFMVFATTRKIGPDDRDSDQLFWVEMDVTNDSSIDQAAEKISQKTQSLDILINNAGVNKDTATSNRKELVCDLKSLNRQALLKMFDVNSVSPLIITQKFLPLLSHSSSFVINISSCRASYHDEFSSSSANYGYKASKSALNMLTFCSVADLPKQVKTFAVHPGSVKTNMNPQGQDRPRDQARQIISITTSWRDEFNGKFLNFDGKFYPL